MDTETFTITLEQKQQLDGSDLLIKAFRKRDAEDPLFVYEMKLDPRLREIAFLLEAMVDLDGLG